MRSALIVTAILFAGCHGSDSSNGAGSAATTPSAKLPPAPAAGSGSAVAEGSAATPTPAPPPIPAVPAIEGHDFTSEGKALVAVGACGDGAVPEGITAEEMSTHCTEVKKAQDDYASSWVKPARAFFAVHVPKDIPKKVVYPFAGGDLSTALTVYPDADEITNISLEPAGDPRDIDTLRGKDLERALKKVAYELKFLYRVNFSNTLNMIDAMRGGQLPTELIFALSALKVHGYELVGLHYFKINEGGATQLAVCECGSAVPQARWSRAVLPPHSPEPRQRRRQGYRPRPQEGSARPQVPRGERPDRRDDEGRELLAVVGVVLAHA